MESVDYQTYLVKALKSLALHDEDARLGLWNFLFDWGNRLNISVGAIQLILQSENLKDQMSEKLLSDLEVQIKSLCLCMRETLAEYSKPNSAQPH